MISHIWYLASLMQAEYLWSDDIHPYMNDITHSICIGCIQVSKEKARRFILIDSPSDTGCVKHWGAGISQHVDCNTTVANFTWVALVIHCCRQLKQQTDTLDSTQRWWGNMKGCLSSSLNKLNWIHSSKFIFHNHGQLVIHKIYMQKTKVNRLQEQKSLIQ